MSEAIEAAKRIVASVAEADAMLVARALLSSPRVEDVRREALEEAAAVADEYARLPPLFNHGTQPSRAEKAVMEAAAIIAQDIRALSPPVG